MLPYSSAEPCSLFLCSTAGEIGESADPPLLPRASCLWRLCQGFQLGGGGGAVSDGKGSRASPNRRDKRPPLSRSASIKGEDG